jgi:hypothetical protein
MIDPDLVELESNFLKAIAQPTRLKILYFLKECEQCQCKIIPFMKEDQSNISVFYKIKDKRIFRLLSLVDQVIKAEIEDRAKRAKVLA